MSDFKSLDLKTKIVFVIFVISLGFAGLSFDLEFAKGFYYSLPVILISAALLVFFHRNFEKKQNNSIDNDIDNDIDKDIE